MSRGVTMSNTIGNTVTLNCKRYVCKIYYKPEYKDGYTIVFKGYRPRNRELVYPYMGCTEYGSYYHGELYNYDPDNAKHLGRRVAFNDLPDAVQKVIIGELTN